MQSIIERINFRNILAITGFASMASALVVVPDVQGEVRGAFIAVLMLIAQFYFRKAPKSESQPETPNTAA